MSQVPPWSWLGPGGAGAPSRDSLPPPPSKAPVTFVPGFPFCDFGVPPRVTMLGGEPLPPVAPLPVWTPSGPVPACDAQTAVWTAPLHSRRAVGTSKRRSMEDRDGGSVDEPEVAPRKAWRCGGEVVPVTVAALPPALASVAPTDPPFGFPPCSPPTAAAAMDTGGSTPLPPCVAAVADEPSEDSDPAVAAFLRRLGPYYRHTLVTEPQSDKRYERSLARLAGAAHGADDMDL